MQRQNIAYSAVLFLTAAIWGFSFVAQRAGMEYVGPYTFNGIRFALGSISLIPLFIFSVRKNKKADLKKINTQIWPKALFLGIVLFIAASLQQIGMQYTTAANGGFITSLYVIFVPLFSIFLRKHIQLSVWVGASLAVLGLYFLSIQSDFSLGWGDTLVLVSAIFWAIHVLLIGRYAPQGSIILLSIIQFATTSILSLSVAFFTEIIEWQSIKDAAIPIIYGGVFSVGIAYTLQVFVQKKVAAEQAAIILSFESAFAMLGGYLLLNETLSLRSLVGATLMLVGIIISQINWKIKKQL
ncbi:MAG: EamA family transporter [Bacteroidales bacterium]|nr:EamA family transporter [Bacteroidales bacterium]